MKNNRHFDEFVSGHLQELYLCGIGWKCRLCNSKIFRKYVNFCVCVLLFSKLNRNRVNKQQAKVQQQQQQNFIYKKKINILQIDYLQIAKLIEAVTKMQIFWFCFFVLLIYVCCCCCFQTELWMRGDWREFPRSDIKLQEKLGEGAFGEVYKGLVQIDGEMTPCAVKKLKGNSFKLI